MFIAAAILIALLVASVLGAPLTRLGDVRLRGAGLVFASLATQLVLFTPLSTVVPGSLETPVHVATYVLLLGFLGLNVSRPGLWLCGMGLAANSIAIFANGGRMPITLRAWTATGRVAAEITTDGYHTNNVLAGPHTAVAWLGDVFALPSVVPLATAFSVGDFLILFGATVFVCRACAEPGTEFARRALEPLGVSGFRRLLAGRVVSKLGDLLTMTAVVTWLYSRTHSTLLVSVFLIARIATATAGGIVTAPLLTRAPGFRTLSLVELARGALTLVSLAFAAQGLVAPVIAVVSLSALIGAATDPSASSLVPELLPEELLGVGNGLHGIARNVAMVVGAAMGAFSVTQFGISGALLIDVTSFGAAALLYARFSGGATTSVENDAPPVSRRELLAGLVSSRLVLGITVSFTIATVAMGLLNASLPRFFATALLQRNGYGYALASIGAGLMCGEFLGGLARTERVERRTITLAFVLSAGVVFVLARTQVAPTAFLLLFVLGVGDGTTEVVRDTLFQRRVSERLRAGTFALSGAVQNVGMVAGFVLAAALRTAVALDVTAACCLGGAVLAALALLRRPRPVPVLLRVPEQP
jgi:uncharacterized protein DUF5317/MFS transporter